MMKLSLSNPKASNPLYDKIEGLTRLQRILVFIGTWVLVIGACVWFLLWPKYEKIDKLETELAKVTKDLEVARQNAAQLDEFKKKMAAAQAEFNLAKNKLPEEKEIPALLESVSQSGQDVGLEFFLFAPGAEVLRDFYAEIPVSVNVQGTYHNAAVFFDKVAGLPRIVNISNLKMTPLKGGSKLDTTCTAVTYKFVEAAPAKPEAGKKGKAAAKGGAKKGK
jgi:type IV pilus assembly protein PilO